MAEINRFSSRRKRLDHAFLSAKLQRREILQAHCRLLPQFNLRASWRGNRFYPKSPDCLQ